MTACVKVYGCQQNEADGEKLRGILSEMGFAMIEREKDADVLILVVCAVREHAELRVLGAIGSQKKRAVFAVCGCVSERLMEKIYKSYKQVNLVFGAGAMQNLPEMLREVMDSGQRKFYKTEINMPIAEDLPILRGEGKRALVSVMTGCNNYCSYCIVPYLRGRERSRKLECVVREVEEAVKSGYREIFLLGQNVNSYQSGDKGFCELLQEIDGIDGEFLVNFMTSHPKDVDEKFLETIANCQKVEKWLHLPVQSGSNKILEAMNRRYTIEEYLQKAEYARKIMPGLRLTSDVIVGFPGESEHDFRDTVKLLDIVKFDGLYAFAYSEREKTPAAEMQNKVSEQEKKTRLLEINGKK